MANGACDFITKPIDFTDMEETINRSFSVLKSSRNALQSREEFVLLKKELNIARDIQKSILPVNFDIETSCKLQARMEPAKEVGGDFYDFFKLGQDHLAMVVADVSGKGISAAVFALINQIKLRSLAGIQKDFSTAKLLEELNSQCCKNNDNCMFITMFYGILNIKTGLLTYTNAGHNPPVLADPSGSCTTLAFTKDTSLGIVEGISYSEKTIQLSKNSVLFIYTDGLTEAMNTQGEEFGEEQLMKELSGMEKQNLEQINSQIYATVKKFEGEAPQFDDLTYLIIKKETD